MRSATSVILIAVLLLLNHACKPLRRCSTPAGGGKGGTYTINVSPTHVGGYVDSCTIYIKYGSLDAPLNGVYDDSLKCVKTDTIPTATFTGLKEGVYYFYGQGYHTSYAAYVKGGINVSACQATARVLLPTYAYIP